MMQFLITLGSIPVNVLVGLDVTINSLFGGRRYQTISSRIAESYDAGGWATRLPLPRWFLNHCRGCVRSVVV